MNRRQFIYGSVATGIAALFPGHIVSTYVSIQNARQKVKTLRGYLDKINSSSHNNIEGLLVYENGDSHGGPFFLKQVFIQDENPNGVSIDISLTSENQLWIGYGIKSNGVIKDDYTWVDLGGDGTAEICEINGELVKNQKQIQESYEKGLEVVLRRFEEFAQKRNIRL